MVLRNTRLTNYVNDSLPEKIFSGKQFCDHDSDTYVHLKADEHLFSVKYSYCSSYSVEIH